MALGQQKSVGVTRSAIVSLIDRTARREAALIAPLVDHAFYLSTYPDVAEAGLDPSFHYAKYGWREGRDPSPSFSTNGYIASHPGVAMRKTNPLLHFVLSTGNGTEISSSTRAEPDTSIDLVREHMDVAYYTGKYPEAARAGTDPAEHFCDTGWRNGFDPSPAFSTNYYLMTNPDIKASGVNPFWHYLIAGRDEGRLPVHPGGWRHDILSKLNGFDAYCEGWLRDEPLPDPMELAELEQALKDGKTSQRLLVSVGHDDYRTSPGGVQLCIQIEADRAAKDGIDYLNIHPWQPLPKLADAGAPPLLQIVLNGRAIGHVHLDLLQSVLSKDMSWRHSDLVVHHLSGHAPEQVAQFAKAVFAGRCQFWLHDYFTLCTSYALQRNNVAPCSAPDMRSNACGVCLFGRARVAQADRMRAFFQAVDVHLVSPSEVALAFWSERSELRVCSKRVHPHLEVQKNSTSELTRPAGDQPLRIGFIGTPVPHKGWPVFIELQRRLSARPDVEFFYVGAEKPDNDAIRHVEAHVTSDDRLSASRSIAAHRVDLVLHWASWRETFSFSAFEALIGGAFLLTNEGSGNVAAAVREHRGGRVLGSTEELFAFATSPQLIELATQARKWRAKTRLDPVFSGMSVDLLPQLETA